MPDGTLVPGKIMFYESKLRDGYVNRFQKINNNTIDVVVGLDEKHLWLEPLKHALFLMLNNKISPNETERYFPCVH